MQFIDVGLTNRSCFFLSDDYPDKELQEFYSYAHPNWKFVVRARPGWDGMIRFLKDGELPAGLFWATKKDVEEKLGIRFRINAKLEQPQFKTEGIITSDRYYQNECRDVMLKACRFGGGLVIAATRVGKTKMCAMLFSCLAGKVCFVVDQLLLLEQARADLEGDLGEEVGWVGKSEFEPRRVTVATRQTMFLHRNRADFKRWTNDLEVLVIDEIHEQMNKSNFSVVEKIMPKAVFGLTATVQLNRKYVRLKAFALTGPVVYTYPLLKGQEEGVLAGGISVSVGYQNPMTKAEMSTRYFNRRWRKWEQRSNWTELYGNLIVDNDERNYLIASLVKAAHKRGKYIIVLVTRLQHLANLSKRLEEIPHRIVSGTFEGKTIKVKDRLIAKSNFEKGKIRLILANTVFKKGITIPRLDVIIDAAAGKSEDDAVQKFGRGIGLHENKVGLIHFDIHDFDGNGNLENYFYLSSRSRIKALETAGIEVHRLRWEDETDTKKIMDRAEKWLKRRVNSGA